MFIVVSVYGWVQWRKSQTQRYSSGEATAIVPTWASWPVRTGLIVVLVGGTLVLTPLFRILGSFEPVWADAWTFVGSLLATYGSVKGWLGCWMILIVVNIVVLRRFLSAGYYASTFVYVCYEAFTLIDSL